MKILVSTKETQGQRKSDFCFVPEGELVTFAMECDGESSIDGSCGCRRSMSGISCHRATTTIKVIDSPITIGEYVMQLRNHEVIIWHSLASKPEELDKMAIELAGDLLRVARVFRAGTVIEKRGNRFQERAPVRLPVGTQLPERV